MTSTPWSVVKRKRSTPASVPPARKRARIDDTPSASAIRQQTLTQAQWVTSAPTNFVDDEDMKPVQSSARPSAKRKLLKKDPTLTQMDFFGRPHMPPEAMDYGLLPVPEDVFEQPLPIPQGDANYDSPRKPRKRKSSVTIASAEDNKRSHQTQGSRDYRPSSRRSNQSGSKVEGHPRRTSKRIASRATILSDPAENLNFFDQALSPPAVKETVGLHTAKLEIQDSTATDDEIQYLPTQSQRPKQSEHPITPRKRSAIVLSSQSPETLSPSTRKTRRTQSDLRSPLRERTVNLPSMYPATPLLDDTPIAKMLPSAAKVETSKLSKKRILDPNPRVEDSQTNLWSVPHSSSPRKNIRGQTTIELDVPEQENGSKKTTLQATKVTTESLEIPSTSQVLGMTGSQPIVENQESLQSLAELVGRPPLPTPADEPTIAQPEEVVIEAETIVRDFAESPSSQLPRQSATDAETVEEALEDGNDMVGDSDSDFGSPIANDTQFNFEVDHRTSTPSKSQSRSSGSKGPHDTQSLSDAIRAQADEALETEPAVPTPRLVSRSSEGAEVMGNAYANSSTDFFLPRLPQNSVSMTQVSTTRVPLNDIQLDDQPSSSPALPSHKSMTQRSVHPAPMPHPSQMSTQEGTQAYYGQSSMVLGEELETPRGTEKITIKDSSSMKMTMSQIPAHRASQSQVSGGMGLDDIDTYEEYDLDPPSSDQRPADEFTRAGSPLQTAESAANPPQTPKQSAQDDEELDPSPSLGPSTQPVDTAAEPPSSPASAQSLKLYSPLKGSYSPIAGFNNDTQSNFTQNGHVSAAYIHRQREKGRLPKWYTPKPYQLQSRRGEAPGYTRR